MKNHLIIIGSGLAGYMLAKEYRKYSPNTPMTVITAAGGCFYSKPLLSTALTHQRTPEMLATNSASEMCQELNATLMTTTTVQSINPDKKEIIYCDANNQLNTLNYSQLVLACGAKPVRASLTGNAADEVLSINHLEDYTRFRCLLKNKKKIVIMGAGLVGCEFANDLLNAGYEVSVIAPENNPLSQLTPAEIGTKLKVAFAKQGLQWYLGEWVKAVNRDQQTYLITLSSGKTIRADLIISAVGLRPNCDLAIDAGLKINHGVVVDRFLQTSDPHIYALGDCAEVAGTIKMYVAPLLQCTRALAKTLSGDQQAVNYPVMPIVIKTPACPLVTMPPPENVQGHWHIEDEGADVRALFHDQQGQLRGFVLVGNYVRDRMQLAKELPIVF